MMSPISAYSTNPMISKQSSIEVLLAAFGLVVSRLLFDFASASAFVYPNYNHGQGPFGFMLFVVTVLAVLVLVLIRLVQMQLLKGLLLLAAVCLVFLIPETPNRYRWKLNVHKAGYMEAIRSDPSPYPKFKIFDWGNRNISFGGGVIFEVVVYDELDNINQAANLGSKDWRGGPGLAMPVDRWITADLPDCPRKVQSLGDHFYFVSMQCT
jgi:hypothetical protein